jgi:hypothetical protein
LERWRESRVAIHWARLNRLAANPHRATKRNLFGSRPNAPKRSPLQVVVSPQVSPVAALAPPHVNGSPQVSTTPIAAHVSLLEAPQPRRIVKRLRASRINLWPGTRLKSAPPPVADPPQVTTVPIAASASLLEISPPQETPKNIPAPSGDRSQCPSSPPRMRTRAATKASRAKAASKHGLDASLILESRLRSRKTSTK